MFILLSRLSLSTQGEKMRTVSYRFDGLSLVIKSSSDKLALCSYIEKCGYDVRIPTPNDKIRVARSYHKENAKMMLINGNWYTLQTRSEYDNDGLFLGYSGLLVLSGADLDDIDLKELLTAFDDGSKSTRFDVAMDITYTDELEMVEQQNRISRLCGFFPSYRNGDVQNPKNAIRGGNKNKRSPIKKCSKISSNGLTLYIGSRTSNFMIRMYDKAAETLSRLDVDIEPTLRFELECKQENAEAIRKYIVDNDKPINEVAKTIWQQLTNDNISFYDKTLSDELGINEVETVELDYSKIENKKMENDNWIKKQVVPSFLQTNNDLTTEQKARKLLLLFLDRDLEDIIITADKNK